MADKDRLEREIDEILNKIERFPSPENRRARARRRVLRRVGGAIAQRQQALLRYVSRVSLGQVMLVSFLMILGSFFFNRLNPLLMQWVLYAGIILLISSFAIYMFSKPAAGQQPTFWRGRKIQYRSEPLSARLRRWFGAMRNRR